MFALSYWQSQSQYDGKAVPAWQQQPRQCDGTGCAFSVECTVLLEQSSATSPPAYRPFYAVPGRTAVGIFRWWTARKVWALRGVRRTASYLEAVAVFSTRSDKAKIVCSSGEPGEVGSITAEDFRSMPSRPARRARHDVRKVTTVCRSLSSINTFGH